MSHTVAYRHRRGMLLLMVMLMLALFMAIGAMLLTIAARARAAARANLVATQQSASSDTICRDALDQALMAAIRGAISGSNGSVTITGSTVENLLVDKYGPSITATGSLTATSGTGTPVMEISLTGLSQSGTTPSRLNGRVLTINPSPGTGDVASYRILGATGISTSTSGTTTCFVAQMPSSVARKLPAPNTSFPIVINGREFTPGSGTTTPEPHDAYDDDNRFLAQPVIQNREVIFFNRISFGGEQSLEDSSGQPLPDSVDNDNDGIPDGAWIPSSLISGTVIPSRPSPLGGNLSFQVSYLILDLDGRININAAGASAAAGNIYGSTPANVPLGMGYGPADLDPSLLFPATLPTGTNSFVTTTSEIWRTLLQSGTPSLLNTGPTAGQRRAQPLLGFIEGRYGQNRAPGIDGNDTGPLQLTGTAIGPTAAEAFYNYWSLVTGSTSTNLADLQARRKVYMTPPAGAEITPSLTFFTGTVAAVDARNAAAIDAADDPYELRLDADGPKPAQIRRLLTSGSNGTTVNPYTIDNPFTLSELERILRPNDQDAVQLPQRLASGAIGHAHQARMIITTDSWDTPALTGGAARAIEDYMATTSTFPVLSYTESSSWRTIGSGSSNPVSPDIAAGLRFNINRPVLSGTSPDALLQQQEYCKGLYTLVLMLGGTAAEFNTNEFKRSAAQWAVNALDFRDEDDRISWFEYDNNLGNGWNVDGRLDTTGDPDRAVVWGAERPDLMIVETAASGTQVLGSGSTPQVFITLRRMEHVVTTTGTSGTNTITSGSLSLASPIWQLRIAPGDMIVRFPSGTASPGPYTLAVSGSIGSAQITPGTVFSGSFTSTGTLTSGTNAHVCIRPTTIASPYGITPNFPSYAIASGTFALPSTATSGTVYLERLSNQSDVSNAGQLENPYVVVDQAVVSVAPQSKRRPLPSVSSEASRARAFWAASPAEWVSGTGTTTLGVYSTGANRLCWYHWPNRPFISQAELALVPAGTASPYQIFADVNFPTSSLANSSAPAQSGTSSLGNLIIDATYVPSRFAGNSLTITGTTLARFGLDIFQANQFSKWREPGKLNINTMVSGTSAGIDADDIVWCVLMGGTTTTNTFAGTPRRRTQPAIPGGPDGPATPAVPGAPGTPARPATTISHLLSLSGTTPTPPHFQIVTSSSTMLSGSSNGFRDTNPLFSYAQAIRLANTATVRSNVFAVWITVKITDDSPNAPSPVTKRMFAIIDRSIPVGYSPNQDLNVRDTIRLKRYLD